MKYISAVLFLCLIQFSAQISTPADPSYIAAVVEYQVQSDEATYLQNYLQLIDNAGNQNADIIIFPEMTLTRGESVVVPIYGLLQDYPIPASHPELFDKILVSISAAARQRRIYVVINVQELMDCRNGSSLGEKCPEQKQYRFNTNVVFDRNGAVIDRYRKINLFGEFSRTAALAPDLGVFSTDFGVTFGHFICFDLMFQVPAIQVVQKNNITDVIFPTMWFSEMPYLTAVEIQQAYAYTMNVNFLTAGANNVRVGSTGSGIFSGKAGALISLMTGVPTTRLLVAKVPKVPGQVDGSYPGPIYDNPSDQDNLLLKTDPSLLAHISKLLQPGFEEFTLIDKDVYCHFRVHLSQRNGETAPFYRAFAHYSFNVYAKRHLGTTGCSIVSCQNEDLKTCIYRFNKTEENRIFEALEIEITSYRYHYNDSLKCNDIVYYPISFRNNYYPLNPQNYTFKIDLNRLFYTIINNDITQNDQQHMTFKLNMPQIQLISFGIWGRIYREDGKDNKQLTFGFRKLNILWYSPSYRYRALAFSGVRTFDGVATGGVKICSVVACTGESIDTCGKRFSKYTPNSTSIFNQLTVKATVPTPVMDLKVNAKNTVYFPVTSDVTIMPLKPDEHMYEEIVLTNGTNIYVFNLKNLATELYAFGIWGRDYTTDGQDASRPLDDTDSSVRNKVNIFLLLLSVLSFILLVR